MTYCPIEIGGELFITPRDSKEQIQEWIRLMDETHMHAIRIFISWGDVQSSQDNWDFTVYDICFREAEDRGMKIIPTLTAISPPGWIGALKEFQGQVDVDDERVWYFCEAYIKKVVERYYQSPALHSWILWNEPTRPLTPNKYNMKGFRSFLEELYEGDIQRLNRLYGRGYKDFDEVGEPKLTYKQGPGWKNYPEQLDWIRYTSASLAEKVKAIGEVVRSIDEKHLLHINPHGVGSNKMDSGQSLWKEGQSVDFLGCSAHPVWHSTRFLPDRIHQSIAYFCDLMKSTSNHPDGLFWVSELQAGPTVFSGVVPACPSPQEIRQWMWESIGAGAKGILFWCFNFRDSGCEAGEWGLLNQAGLPSERLKTAGEVAQLVEDHKDLFAQVKPVKPDVYLLFSEDTWNMGLMEGWGEDVRTPRNRQMGSDALCGAYLMAADLGLEVGFINEEKLINGEVCPEIPLILPGVTCLSAATLQGLAQWVEKGGRVIADGLCGWKDENGFLTKENRKIMEKVFGVMLVDIETDWVDKKPHIVLEDLRAQGWFVKCKMTPLESCEVIGRFDDGIPAIARNDYGAGQAVRVGTVFFQRYLSNPQREDLKLLSVILGEQRSKKMMLIDGSSSLRMKRLEAGNEGILILLNYGSEAIAKVWSEEPCTLMSLNEKCGTFSAAEPGRVLSIPMGEQEVKVFLIK